MAGDVDIANMALSRLGTRATIADFAEDSTEARVVRTWYAATRDALLGAHAWNFARVRRALSLSGIAPAGWRFSYALPSECLRFLGIDASRGRDGREQGGATSIPFELASDGTGRFVLCDATGAIGLYTQRVTDPGRLDAAFVAALVDQLAARMAYPITQKSEVAVRLAQMARVSLDEARALDGNEGHPRAWATGEPDYIAARS
jgi:hypothetical protein